MYHIFSPPAPLKSGFSKFIFPVYSAFSPALKVSSRYFRSFPCFISLFLCFIRLFSILSGYFLFSDVSMFFSDRLGSILRIQGISDFICHIKKQTGRKSGFAGLSPFCLYSVFTVLKIPVVSYVSGILFYLKDPPLASNIASASASNSAYCASVIP